MIKNALVSQVLEASAGRAPDMTHALRSLGNSDMGAGITELWSTGKRIGWVQGSVVTAMVFSIALSVGFLCQHNRNSLKNGVPSKK